MKRRLVVALACALVVVALTPGAAQTGQQRPVFRSGAIFVNVDAYPRRDGKVVEDLTKADFEIFEDGKPQAVENFEFVRVAPNTPEADRKDPTSVTDANRQAADPHNRVFVVYLDVFHVGFFGTKFSREPIVTFLNRTIGPSDLFALTTPELPPSALTFGRRTETIESDLNQIWPWGEADWQTPMARNTTESKLLLCPDGNALVRAFREELQADNLDALMIRLRNLRDERKNILFISGGWAPTSGQIGAGGGQRPHTPTIGMGPSGRLGVGTDMSGMSDAAWCASQSVRLASIDYERRFRDLLEAARRANVAFYTVDVGGLRTYNVPASRAPQPGENPLAVAEAYRSTIQRGVETLQTLAENTDGKAIVNTNDLVSGVRKISDDLSAYYLLGYYSSNSAADGKFRRIEVKVKSPGVKVSARRGYTAPTEEMRKAEAAAAAKPVRETTAVDLELNRLSRIRTDARLYTAAIHTASGLDVMVELPSSAVSSDDWRNGATVKVEVTPKDGGTAVTAEGKIEAGLRGALVKVPLGAAPASGWRVRVRASGAGEPADDELEIAAPATSFIGGPSVFRAGTGSRSPLRPVADYKFYRTERLHAEWTLTKALDDRTARLLSRSGEPLPVPVALTERPDGDRIVLAADLALAPLADGDYVIEVSATAGTEKVLKLLAFRVIR